MTVAVSVLYFAILQISVAFNAMLPQYRVDTKVQRISLDTFTFCSAASNYVLNLVVEVLVYYVILKTMYTVFFLTLTAFSLQHSSASECSPVYWAMCGSHSLSPSL